MKDFPNVAASTRAAMRANKGKDTKPEMIVRRAAHSLGYRFRLHRNDLPGKPDLVFSSRRKIIMVHGCFWHRHLGCSKATVPKTRIDYWEPKFRRNVERDANAERLLNQLGWQVLLIWECETRNTEAIASKLQEFLGPSHLRPPPEPSPK